MGEVVVIVISLIAAIVALGWMLVRRIWHGLLAMIFDTHVSHIAQARPEQPGAGIIRFLVGIGLLMVAFGLAYRIWQGGFR